MDNGKNFKNNLIIPTESYDKGNNYTSPYSGLYSAFNFRQTENVSPQNFNHLPHQEITHIGNTSTSGNVIYNNNDKEIAKLKDKHIRLLSLTPKLTSPQYRTKHKIILYSCFIIPSVCIAGFFYTKNMKIGKIVLLVNIWCALLYPLLPISLIHLLSKDFDNRFKGKTLWEIDMELKKFDFLKNKL